MYPQKKRAGLDSSRTDEGRYMYGIVAESSRREFGPIGIGNRGNIVYTLPFQGLAVIVSNAPIVKYPVTRDNTLAHARVLEMAMQDYTILPVRYCTIAEEEEIIIEKVLKPRYQEFMDVLRQMDGKMELGVRARWTDMGAIFAEVVEENKEVKAIKEALLREKSEQRRYGGKIKLGEMVQKALEAKQKREADELLDALKPLSHDYKVNATYGDMNLLNAAFLVAKEREGEFDRKMQELEREYGARKQLKYVGPIAPYNFVEVVVNW